MLCRSGQGRSTARDGDTGHLHQTGLDKIRPRSRGQRVEAGACSAPNSEGACPNCNGAGVIYTELALMAGVAFTCEDCEGKRFDASVMD